MTKTTPTHSELVKEILAARETAAYDQRCVAIAETDDCSLPHLVLEILGSDGQFERLFERELMTAEGLQSAHLPVIVRLSMYGQPVVATNA
jgi:hypothetical protein